MNLAKRARLLRKFEESQVRRDDRGRFADKGGASSHRNPYYGKFHSTGPSTSFRQEIDSGPRRSSGQVSSLYGKARVTDEGMRRLEHGIARGEGALAAAERLHAARGDEASLATRDRHKAKLESLKDAKLVSQASERAEAGAGEAFFRMKTQVPPGMGVAEYVDLSRRAIAGTRALRSPIMERAVEQGILPKDHDPKIARKALNIGQNLALRSAGLVSFDYSFGPDKEAMRPYEPMMRYAARRTLDHLRSAHKGQWNQFKEAFGKPLIDKKSGEQKIHPKTGRPRFSFPSHQSDLIKGPAGEALRLKKIIPAAVGVGSALWRGASTLSTAKGLYQGAKAAVGAVSGMAPRLGDVGRAGAYAGRRALGNAASATRAGLQTAKAGAQKHFTAAGVRSTARSNYRAILKDRMLPRTTLNLGGFSPTAFRQGLRGSSIGRAARRFKATPLQGTLARPKAQGALTVASLGASALPDPNQKSKPLY